MPENNQHLFLLFITSFLALIGLFFVSTFLHACRRFRTTVKHLLLSPHPPLYLHFQKIIGAGKVDDLLFFVTCVQNALRVLVTLFLCVLFVQATSIPEYLFSTVWKSSLQIIELFVFLFALLLILLVLGDFGPRLWAYFGVKSALNVSLPIASPFLFLFSPFSFVLFKLLSLFVPSFSFSSFGETLASKERLLELIRDVDDGNFLNEHDKKLIQSVLNFRDRIAREVMVPRMDSFALLHNATIRQVSNLIQKRRLQPYTHL